MAKLTQEQLKELLHYDPATGVFVWNRNGKVAGSNAPTHRRIRIDGKKYFLHRLAFLYVTGHMPSVYVDHINGDPTDNRWKNLREATASQNKMNCKSHRDNRSGVKGVYWDKTHKKWRGRVMVDGRNHHVGLFETINDAAIAMKQARISLHENYAHE